MPRAVVFIFVVIVIFVCLPVLHAVVVLFAVAVAVVIILLFFPLQLMFRGGSVAEWLECRIDNKCDYQ